MMTEKSLTDREEPLEIGSVIKIKWGKQRHEPDKESDGCEKKERSEKYQILKIKWRGDSKGYQCKVQSLRDQDKILKVLLNEVDWKLVENSKKLSEEHHKSKKRKRTGSLELAIIESPQRYQFKRSIPPAVLKYILAPMVGASELAFRILCRRYGATLAYTPMMNSERFAVDENYRREEFQTNDMDRPLVAHFCANNPEFFLKAVRHVEHQCDAIDLNLGCPQRVAYSGHFGSFLLDEVDRPLVLSMIRTIAENAIVPIFAKIRLLDTVEDTIRLCRQLVEAGASLIAIHGRYRVNLVGRTGPGARDGPAHLDQIQTIRAAIPAHIPIIANGNIITWEDVENNLAFTQCNGVMSAEGILDNPALFNEGKPVPRLQLAKEYLTFVQQYPVKLKTLIFHIRRMCKEELLRFQLMEDCLSISSLPEMQALLQRLEQYVAQPELFTFNQQQELAMKKRLEKKKNEENKRKLFEQRMIRKAKREGRSDLFYYLSIGAEIPTIEKIQELKQMDKDAAFTIWKNQYSQHCWNYHFNTEKGCERDRTCAFLHMDPKYLEESETVYG